MHHVDRVQDRDQRDEQRAQREHRQGADGRLPSVDRAPVNRIQRQLLQRAVLRLQLMKSPNGQQPGEDQPQPQQPGRCIGKAARVRPEREPKEQEHHRGEGERRDRGLLATQLGNRVLARDGPGNRRGPAQDGHVATSTRGSASRSRARRLEGDATPATLVTMPPSSRTVASAWAARCSVACRRRGRQRQSGAIGPAAVP